MNSGPRKKTGNSNRNRGRNQKNRRRRRSGSGQRERKPPVEKFVAPPPRRFGVVFYESHQQAREDSAQLLEKAREVDQLNIVIKAEGTMDDPELLQYGKLYAGEAWYTIHQRRVEEGWYEVPH